MKIKNLINDSSFEKDIWGGANYSTAEKLHGNRSLYFPIGGTVVANINIDRPILGHKYYGRRYIKTNGDNQPADCRFEVYAGDGVGLNWVYAWNRGNYEQWGFDSELYEITEINYPEDTQTTIRCFNVATTAECWIDGLMLIDLTECFSLENEPTKEWCDANIPYFEDTYTILEELIFDRTQADVDYAKENQASAEFLKGAYNYTDLNRVEEWCEYVANRLNEYNYFVDIVVKTNWTMLDFPTSADMERIRSNVEKMKKAYYSFKEVPDTLNKIDIDKANAIEKILSEIDYLINNMIEGFYYCNEIYAGEV